VEPDSKPKGKLKLDARLETIRSTIESQPTAIQVTLSDTAVAMLLVTRKLRDKRAGIVNLTMNPTLYPRSCNLKVKLAFPNEMKDDEKTIANSKKWDEFIQTTKDEMKKQLVTQGERTISFMSEKRLELFNERLLTIAEGYVTWYSALDDVEAENTVSNHAYGAASIYCYFDTIAPNNCIFEYLGVNQDIFLEDFKKKHLTTATGKLLFTTDQLTLLTAVIPGAHNSPLRINDDEETRTRTGDEDDQQTQQNNVTMGQPEADNPPTQITPGMENVVYKAKTKLLDLIPILFVNLGTTIDATQREITANAKLEASLKGKQTLDMAKLLDADMATQAIVAPENMKDLVHSLVDSRISLKSKQAQKAATKAALQSARKKSLGGADTAKTPPGKHKAGGRQGGILKRTSFGLPQPQAKRAKKNITKAPEQAYRQLEQQRRTHNPYAANRQYGPTSRNSSHSGRGYSQGRGRGRNQSRGGSNRGRGRGHGRF
jgi:hypothetical protein